MKTEPRSFGNFLKMMIAGKGLSRHQFVAKSGISLRTIERAVSKADRPRLHERNYVSICAALGLTTADFESMWRKYEAGGDPFGAYISGPSHTLTIEGLPADLKAKLQTIARREHRTLENQILAILDRASRKPLDHEGDLS